MKIMRIMDRLNTGGPAIHAVLLTKHMNPSGCAPDWRTVLVVGKVGANEGDMEWLAKQEGVELRSLPSLGRELHPIHDVKTLLALIALIRTERPDVVHTHKSKAGAIGRLAARLCGVPVVVHTFHGHVLHGYFGRLKTTAFRLIERAMAVLSDRIIAVSPGVKSDLVRYRIAPESKIDVVLLGLDLGRFSSALRSQGALQRELGVPASTPLVGLVARLVPIKAVPVFLDAARIVAQSRSDVVFTIVGDGEERRKLEGYSRRLGISDRIRFLGFRSDLDRIYPDLDVLCLTSDNEGSPVSLIEGLASACAVVATDVGGVRDVLEDGRLGILVPKGDAQALAREVQALLSHRERREAMGAEGRRAAVARFSIERLVRDLDSLYRELLMPNR